jgi:hypothetical protein
MYLTDYRERSLKDVITQLEPGLFKKVTGLSVKDFELLCSLNLFNPSRMNDAIFKFKRYEDTSLSYTGIDKPAGMAVGGWDTVIKREEYEKLYAGQQETMTSGLRTSGGAPIVAVPVRDKKPAPTPSEPTATPKKPIVGTVPQKPTHTPTAIHKPPIEKPREAYVPPHVEVGTRVMHKIFGAGKIEWIAQNKKYIYVSFEGRGKKTFPFPDAFKNGFLTI